MFHSFKIANGCRQYTLPQKTLANNYKDYKNPISRGEQKHWDEIGLCKCADHVVAVGPRLETAHFSYLQGCKKQEDIFGLTPGLFDREFGDNA